MQILTYPKDVKPLREIAQPVTQEMLISDEFKANVEKMKVIAKQDGIGLAATQVGWPVQVFVLLVNRNLEKCDPVVVVNPKITFESEETAKAPEGCLSFPELELKVTRAASIKWEAQDLLGNRTESEETFIPKNGPGYFIRVIQHEVDHLNGKLFIDKISATENLKFKRWLKKREDQDRPW